LCKILQSLFLLLKESSFIIFFFQIHCSYLLLKILHVWAKHWVVCCCFKELIKLRIHSLEIKELIFIYIFERKQLTFICVISISFQFVPGTEQRLLGFSLHFQRNKWPLTLAVKYFSAAVTARCPHHIFVGNSHSPNDFRFLLSYSYNNGIF